MCPSSCLTVRGATTSPTLQVMLLCGLTFCPRTHRYACLLFQVWPGEALLRTLVPYWKALGSWWSTPPATTYVMRAVNWLFVGCTLVWCAGCLHTATCPRQHGGRVLPGTKEDLAYWQRLLAVATLGMVRRACTYIVLLVSRDI